MKSIDEYIREHSGVVVNAGVDKVCLTFIAPIPTDDVVKTLRAWGKVDVETPWSIQRSPKAEKKTIKVVHNRAEYGRYVFNGFTRPRALELVLLNRNKAEWKLEFNGSLCNVDKYKIRCYLIELFGKKVLSAIYRRGRVADIEQFYDIAGIRVEDVAMKAKGFSTKGMFVDVSHGVTSRYEGELAYKIYDKQLELLDNRRNNERHKIGYPQISLVRFEKKNHLLIPPAKLSKSADQFDKLHCYDLRVLRETLGWDCGYDMSLSMMGRKAFLGYLRQWGHPGAKTLSRLIDAASFDGLGVAIRKRHWDSYVSALDFLNPKELYFQEEPQQLSDFYRHYGYVTPDLLCLATHHGDFRRDQWQRLDLDSSLEAVDLLGLPITEHMAVELIGMKKRRIKKRSLKGKGLG